MIDELVAMAEALLDAIESQSNLPEMVGGGGIASLIFVGRPEPRREVLSTNASTYSAMKQGKEDFIRLYGVRGAELAVADMINHMLFTLSYANGKERWHLRALPNQSVMLEAVNLTTRYFEENPRQG